jgi:hypothetical protein
MNGYLNNTYLAMVTMKLTRMTQASLVLLLRHTKISILVLLCFLVIGYFGVQIGLDSKGSSEPDNEVWGQTPEVFPNSTLPAILGNRSLIPGMHVMSLVNDVTPTWLIISSDNELSVNMRYESATGVPSPTVSLLATALKTTGASAQMSPSAVAYERATGTNITQAGWISPITVPIFVNGTLSLYDADLIVVMIVPYTGPSLTNSTSTNSSVLPQDQNVT